MKEFPDLVGQTFGSLTVESLLSGERLSFSRWTCRCICGALVESSIYNLKQMKSPLCGCVVRNRNRQKRTVHGRSRSSEYAIWSSMISRCEKKTNKSYVDYGAKGITVCPRWRDSVDNFLADMGKRPSRHHSLDRIDFEKGYSPENCQWASLERQANNKRSNHLLTARGKTMTMAEWAREVGLPHDTLERRVNLLKWDHERAIFQPPRGWGPGRPRGG